MTPSTRRRLGVFASSAGCVGLAVAVIAPARAGIVDEPISHSAPDAAIGLASLGTYETGIFDEAAAEIVAYDAGSQRLFVVNAAQAEVEVLDVADPAAPAKLFDLPTVGTGSGDGSSVPEGSVANSVDVRADGLGVVVVEAATKTDSGWAVFFDARSDDGAALGAVRVGAQPDMVTFTPDGSRVVVANEGEPAEDYAVDPEGSVSVVAAPDGLAAPEQDAVAVAGFHAFEAGGSLPLPDDVRIFGGREDAGTGTPELPVSENLEPEYVVVDASGERAYVALQEANAIATVDLAEAQVTGIAALGFKDHAAPGNELDPSDDDGAVTLGSWPVRGMYQPDGIDAYTVDGETYLVTANEGDSREWEGYSEVARVKDLGADGLAPVCDDLADLTDDDALGRLNVTTATGLAEDGSCYEQLYAYGARSFSVWDAEGSLVFDSGSQFEEIVAEAVPGFFNSNHTESNLEGRSDDKGPEPENLTIGEVDGRTYAFIGFERVGGVVAFDLTDPAAPSFVTYVNNRDFAVSVEDGGALDGAGDLGPEGLEFIAAEDSSLDGVPLLAVANEVSGTTTLLRIDLVDDGDGGDESGDDAGGDVAGGDVAGDVSGGDVAGGDASGGDVAGGDASGGDVSGGDDGSTGGDDDGAADGDLPDTGASPASLLGLVVVLGLAGAAALWTRRSRSAA